MLKGWFTMAGLALSAAAFCAPEVRVTTAPLTETVDEAVAAKDMRAETGFCYIASLRMGRTGDKDGKSECVLTEDGKPLGPAHAGHADIRSLGKGRYSHWIAGGLYFSASDNTDPRTNGRKYVLSSQSRGLLCTAVTTLNAPAGQFQLTGGPAASVRRLALRNLDDKTAIVAAVRAANRPDFSSVDAILGGIIKPDMTPEQKSVAIWKFLVDWRYHYLPAEGGAEIHDPVKFFCVYGYGFCDDCAQNFVALCQVAGIKTRPWGLGGHVVAEAFFDNGWHMFDPDHECYFRAADGHILGVEELAKDPSAILAKPTDPTGYSSKSLAELYTTTQDNAVISANLPATFHRIAPVLLPGDEVLFDYGPAKRVHSVTYAEKPGPPKAANGTLTRRVAVGQAGDELLIPVTWCHVLVGGELALSLAGAEKPGVSISPDGKQYSALPVVVSTGRLTADLADWFTAQKVAPYAFTIRIERTGAAPLNQSVKEATLRAVFQFAPKTMLQVQPETATYRTALTASDGTTPPAGFKGVEMRLEWARGEDTKAK